MYKTKIYWLNTTKYCGAIAKNQDGTISVYDTAPCYRWAEKKGMKFSDVIDYYKRKNWLITCKKIHEIIEPF